MPNQGREVPVRAVEGRPRAGDPLGDVAGQLRRDVPVILTVPEPGRHPDVLQPKAPTPTHDPRVTRRSARALPERLAKILCKHTLDGRIGDDRAIAWRPICRRLLEEACAIFRDPLATRDREKRRIKQVASECGERRARAPMASSRCCGSAPAARDTRPVRGSGNIAAHAMGTVRPRKTRQGERADDDRVGSQRGSCRPFRTRRVA